MSEEGTTDPSSPSNSPDILVWSRLKLSNIWDVCVSVCESTSEAAVEQVEVWRISRLQQLLRRCWSNPGPRWRTFTSTSDSSVQPHVSKRRVSLTLWTERKRPAVPAAEGQPAAFPGCCSQSCTIVGWILLFPIFRGVTPPSGSRGPRDGSGAFLVNIKG